ncbi:NAD(P)-dependent alcohol dehydrogenase [Nonomuraea sp. NPDC050556]|uniref:NAD(P)-dependent alcohol dehydrogenase n=1 Tax=Nonomuraea sp. NPDC050556 TaxID=3364369 RepID=UPI00378DB084
MRAIVHHRYGPPEVLRLDDVAKPVPADDEVLVRVRATTVSRTDCAFRAGKPFVGRFVTGLRRPKWPVLGGELAGEVEAAGSEVTEFQPGDRVFGLNPWRFGAHADYVCVPESAPLAHMPDALPFEEAGAVCDGVVLALLGLRPARVRAGTRILVYGASGSIGTAVVQLSRHFDAEITAVCGPESLDLVRELGADHAIDRFAEDFTRNGNTYDVIFDAVGKHSYRRCRDSLGKDGVYVASDHLSNVILALTTKRVIFPVPPEYRKDDIRFLRELIEAGKYRAVVDRRYPLEDVVEATRYVETEQKTGNVVLNVA